MIQSEYTTDLCWKIVTSNWVQLKSWNHETHTIRMNKSDKSWWFVTQHVSWFHIKDSYVYKSLRFYLVKSSRCFSKQPDVRSCECFSSWYSWIFQGWLHYTERFRCSTREGIDGHKPLRGRDRFFVQQGCLFWFCFGKKTCFCRVEEINTFYISSSTSLCVWDFGPGEDGWRSTM